MFKIYLLCKNVYYTNLYCRENLLRMKKTLGMQYYTPNQTSLNIYWIHVLSSC